MFRRRPLAFLACAALIAASSALGGGAALPPFSEYAVILERKPFGDLAKVEQAPGVDPAEAAQAEQQKKDEQALARQIDLVAVNITPRGKLAVGIVDKSTKPSRSLYIAVGESEFGYTVVDANFDEETAVIEKDGTSVTLKLGKGLVEAKPEGDGEEQASGMPVPGVPFLNAPVQPGMPRAGMPNFRGMPWGGVPPGGGEAGAPAGGETPRGIRPPWFHGNRGGYRDRVRMNRMADAQAQAEEQARMREELKSYAETATKEAAAKREREMNLELVKQGKEPLSPIELTPEEDAELEKSGVFSRQEVPQEAPQ